jgi:hypothetical protein
MAILAVLERGLPACRKVVRAAQGEIADRGSRIVLSVAAANSVKSSGALLSGAPELSCFIFNHPILNEVAIIS